MSFSYPFSRFHLQWPEHPCQRWGKSIGAIAVSLFFPTHIILQLAFSPYIRTEELLKAGLSPQGFIRILLHLNALEPGVLFGHILPWLLIGLGLCMAMAWLGGQLGQLFARYIAFRFLKASLPE